MYDPDEEDDRVFESAEEDPEKRKKSASTSAIWTIMVRAETKKKGFTTL